MSLIQTHVTPSTAFLVALAVALPLYLWRVRSQRWKLYDAVHKKYQKKYEDRTLTPEEAQEIMHVSCFWDMPLLMDYSLAFALFKTYAIPTISELLSKTGEMGCVQNISKRYADVATWIVHPISGFMGRKDPPTPGAKADPRAMIALARVNWLHAHYKISNDDYLYTLGLFILEPALWAERYGWRELSDMEKYEYEERTMVPAQTNHDVAQYTMEELLYIVPERFGLKNFARGLAICLLPDRVRVAMMLPEQSWYRHVIARNSVKFVHWVQRWFCLPRTEGRAPVSMKDPKIIPGKCPRLHPAWNQVRPWYRAESTGLGYYWDRFLVALGKHSEMPGPHLRSEGYRIEEMGPVRFEKTAHEEIMRNAAELQGYPITGPWSLSWDSTKN
ncbi:hypothetical protein AX16_000679 [Volvariella volvacea WC 439]|nr:hypothetical protein AX16_000679 [Volvariella volvacea WC 439]